MVVGQEAGEQSAPLDRSSDRRRRATTPPPALSLSPGAIKERAGGGARGAQVLGHADRLGALSREQERGGGLVVGEQVVGAGLFLVLGMLGEGGQQTV